MLPKQICKTLLTCLKIKLFGVTPFIIIIFIIEFQFKMVKKDLVLLQTVSLRSRVSTVPLKRCLSHAYSSCVVIRCSKKESEISQLLPFLLRLHLPSRFVVLIVGLITGVTNYIMVHPRGGGVGGLNLFLADILTRL